MWIIFSLLAAIVSAIYNLTAQNMKIDANTFMIYRGLVIPVVLAPFLIINTAIFSVEFYLLSVTQGIISAYVDYLVFGINKKYGSEVVSSITPLAVILVFLMWCFITPSIIISYLQNITNTIFILIAISGVVYALTHYYKVKFTREAFLKMIPVVTLSAVFAVLNKTIMNYSGNDQFICACQRAFIVGVIISILHLFLYVKKKLPLRNLILPANLLRSMIFLWLLLYMIMMSYAMYYAANPAYVSCIVYTSLIWVMLLSRYVPYFKFHTKEKQTAKRWKILFVFSVILLIIATNR